MSYDTVETYVDFLRLVEHPHLQDNVIHVSSSSSPSASHSDESEKKFPVPTSLVNLNLNLDINRYYEQLSACSRNPLSMLPLHSSGTMAHGHLSHAVYFRPPVYMPTLEEMHVPDEVLSLDSPELEDDLDDEDYEVPPLFPLMNVNDETQFMPFEVLPLNPSYVEH